MKLPTLALTALAPLAAVATECQNEDFDHDPLNISTAAAKSALHGLRTRDLTVVNMYWHLLVSKTPDNDPTPSMNAQIEYLNNHYNPWGYQLVLKDYDVTVNASWAADIDTDKGDKMNALHRGDYQTLNVYLVEGGGGGTLSPSHTPFHPSKKLTDLCTLQAYAPCRTARAILSPRTFSTATAVSSP